LVEGLVDEKIIGQLAGILREINSQGQMKIEAKEKARARGVPSPDRAETLMLAICKPPQTIEYHSSRDLQHLRQLEHYRMTTMISGESIKSA
jgi:hypothetical protein